MNVLYPTKRFVVFDIVVSLLAIAAFVAVEVDFKKDKMGVVEVVAIDGEEVLIFPGDADKERSRRHIAICVVLGIAATARTAGVITDRCHD